MSREPFFCYFCWRRPVGSVVEELGRHGREVWHCWKHSNDAFDLAYGYVHRVNGYPGQAAGTTLGPSEDVRPTSHSLDGLEFTSKLDPRDLK